jgi:uncharacterized protein (DUF983 family)
MVINRCPKCDNRMIRAYLSAPHKCVKCGYIDKQTKLDFGVEDGNVE